MFMNNLDEFKLPYDKKKLHRTKGWTFVHQTWLAHYSYMIRFKHDWGKNKGIFKSACFGAYFFDVPLWKWP